ncbi:hypothetical protein Plhal304r1_c006g0023531 [Plasmopara halstedii]
MGGRMESVVSTLMHNVDGLQAIVCSNCNIMSVFANASWHYSQDGGKQKELSWIFEARANMRKFFFSRLPPFVAYENENSSLLNSSHW